MQDADALDPFRLERGDRLVNQAECRNHEGDALALSESASNNVRSDDSLAGAGRERKHWPPVTSSDGLPQSLQGTLLMWT